MAPSLTGSSPGSDPGRKTDSGTLELVNERALIEGFHQRLAEAMTRLDYPKASLFAVRLALHEAISNAFQHGHKLLSPTTPISIDFSIDASSLRVGVEDKGPGFDPSNVPDPTLDEHIEGATGRGLMLIRAYMATAQYTKGGRRLDMEYRRPPGPQSGR